MPGGLILPKNYWGTKDEVRIPYRLPTSMVDLTIARSTRAVRTGGQLTNYRLEFDYEATIATHAIADLTSEQALWFQPRALSDAVLKVGFGEGELLTSVNHESTGALPSIVSSIVSFASFAAAAAVSLATFTQPAPEPPAAGPSDAERFAALFPAESARGQSLPGKITSIDSAIDALAEKLPSEEDAKKASTLASQIKSLKDARDVLDADLENLRSLYRTWLLSENPDPETGKYALTIGTVFRLAASAPPATVAPDTVPEWPASTRFEDAQVILALHDPARPVEKAETEDAPSEEGDFVIRRPRPVTFCIYGKRGPSSATYDLIDSVPGSIVDSHSAVVSIPLAEMLASKATASATLSANGSATQLEFSSTSFFKEIAQSLANAPSQISGQVETAKNLTDNFLALRQQPTLHQIQELENKKKLLDAEIAFGGASAGRALREELERVNNELTLAKAKKDLTEAQS